MQTAFVAMEKERAEVTHDTLAMGARGVYLGGSLGTLIMAVIIGGSMADDIRRTGDDSKEDDNAENCDPR